MQTTQSKSSSMALQQRGFAALWGGQQGGSFGARKHSQVIGPEPQAAGYGSQDTLSPELRST
jgi:hypothetical protein